MRPLPDCCLPAWPPPLPSLLQAQHLRPYAPARMHAAAGGALLYCTALAALLGLCGYALFGSAVQVGARWACCACCALLCLL